MAPQQASLQENEALVYKKLFPPEKVKVQELKFQVDDQVCITIKQDDFRKGYRPNFTKELFTISEVLVTTPISYRIKAIDDEVIEGTFYKQEMVKVHKTGTRTRRRTRI